MRRLAVLALLAATALACGRGAPAPAPEWARAVAEAHAQADALVARGDAAGVAGARHALEAAVERAAAAPEQDETRRVLLQDTYFRLAQLALSAREPSAALHRAEQGLALGGDDLFVANLLVARAAAREGLGQAPAAVLDYERALHINEGLLRATLEPR